MVNILLSAGYDCALSIADLDEVDIQSIQQLVSSKSQELLKNTAYVVGEPFEFLPGHRKLLYVLRKKAIEFIEESRKASESGNIRLRLSEEIELLTVDEIEALKKSLVKKLNIRATSIGLKKLFTEENIVSALEAYVSHHSRNSKASYKCTVKCVSCEKMCSVYTQQTLASKQSGNTSQKSHAIREFRNCQFKQYCEHSSNHTKHFPRK